MRLARRMTSFNGVQEEAAPAFYERMAMNHEKPQL